MVEIGWDRGSSRQIWPSWSLDVICRLEIKWRRMEACEEDGSADGRNRAGEVGRWAGRCGDLRKQPVAAKPSRRALVANDVSGSAQPPFCAKHSANGKLGNQLD